MKTNIETNKIDAILLCGGLGKRLRPVLGGKQKVMAEIKKRPFLDIVIKYVAKFGFKRFILCVGYKGDEIKRYYQNKENRGIEIIFSEEKDLLGTGGAIKNAEPLIKSSPILIMNSDSLCEFDLKKFLDFHSAKNALVSMVLADIKGTTDYGAVSLGESCNITGFNEKSSAAKGGFISIGVYLFEKAALSSMPQSGKFSLEYDFFPKILNKMFFGYVTKEPFIDIGTPEKYKKAKGILEA